MARSRYPDEDFLKLWRAVLSLRRRGGLHSPCTVLFDHPGFMSPPSSIA